MLLQVMSGGAGEARVGTAMLNQAERRWLGSFRAGGEKLGPGRRPQPYGRIKQRSHVRRIYSDIQPFTSLHSPLPSIFYQLITTTTNEIPPLPKHHNHNGPTSDLSRNPAGPAEPQRQRQAGAQPVRCRRDPKGTDPV
jgi:hypothetical protein